MQYMEIHGWYGEFKLQGCTSNVVEKPHPKTPPCQLRSPACCANSGRPENDLPSGSGYQHKHAQKGRKGYFNTRKISSSNHQCSGKKTVQFQGKFQPKQPKLLHFLRKFFETNAKNIIFFLLKPFLTYPELFDIHMNDIS